MATINATGIYYKSLNKMIKENLKKGENEIILENVLGQRYIGGGIHSNSKVHIHGIPGQDLGAFMNGLDIVVYQNAQDGVANTMNSGRIVIHGKAGEIPGHAMRGGKVFIKGDVEYRAGIHMKEYMDQIPWLIIGGTAKDYCGEYMAGGRIIVLNLENKKNAVGYDVGTGIHGGVIYIRTKIEKHQLGRGAMFAKMKKTDIEFLETALDEYSKELGIDISGISLTDFIKITKKGKRPFANLYTSALSIKNLKPKHLNLTPPCMYSCPTGIPTPVYIHMIRNGEVRDAQLLMDEFSPFRMSVCGHVCPAPCMDVCSRNQLDGPVEIQEIARKYYPNFNPIQPTEMRKELVSIIGAGPAGLSAAWQLARRGYNVQVYDASDDLGGKLRKAIPSDRLADDILNKDINRIKSYPITFILNKKIDRRSFEEIHNKSNAVLIATGAHLPKRIPYPGGENIISGLNFLVDIKEGRGLNLYNKKVLIIGAGNVGMDIACEAWRLGATKVTAIDIQKPLAFGKELDTATKLGTEILWPKAIEKLNDRKIYFKDNTTMEADLVLFSIGEVPDSSFLPESVIIGDRGYMITGDKSFKSSDPKIFGAGDIVKPGLITDALGSGRLAAMEVHAMLNNEVFIYPEKKLVPKNRINTAYFGKETREVDRCLSCGTCIFCDKCTVGCPQGAISRNGEIFTIDTMKCTRCYTCVNICPRGALQNEYFDDFVEEDIDTE